MTKKIIINDVYCWMDGGTVTLKMSNDRSAFYEVEFVQKVILEKSTRADYIKPIPGSLLLNKKEVEIRSELEKEILSDIKIADFGTTITEKEKNPLKEIIADTIKFVESEEYIIVAKKMGRIK